MPMLLAMVGMASLGSTAHAQIWPWWPWCPPQIITCNYVGPIRVLWNGTTLVGTSSGAGSYQVVSSAGGPGTTASVSYVPTDINASSNLNGGLGTILTTLTQNAPIVISSTTANNAGVLYPARSEMAFYATARLPDGTAYTSDGPVTFVAENANSFGPFRQEPFHLLQPVTFSNSAGIGFTLLALDATFNN